MKAWGRKVFGEFKKLKGQSDQNKTGQGAVIGDTAEDNRWGLNEAAICWSC